VRYYGLYGNAHRGKARKAQPDKHPFIIIEQECPRVPRRGWAGVRLGRDDPESPRGGSPGL
jgi:hypothetical protein